MGSIDKVAFAAKRRNCLFVGNPGVGKSTLLNCLMKMKNSQQVELFKSGISIAVGMTYQFDKITVDDTIFMDTPGLQDVKLREQAAEAITNALKQSGCYQIIFVVTLESGRVRPQDLAVVNLVLESAKEITHYGIIFNKLSKPFLKRINNREEEKMELLVQVTLNEDEHGRKTLPIPLYLRKISEIEDEDDVTTNIPELVEFMKTVPPIVIHEDKVDKIEVDKYEKKSKELESQINALIADKDLMMQKIEEGKKEYEAKMNEVMENEKKRHNEEMQRIKEQNEQHLKLIQEKEKEHRDELKRLKTEDEKKHAILIEKMNTQGKQRLEEMKQQHQQQLARDEQLRQEMMKNHQMQMEAARKRRRGGGCSIQ